MSNKTLLTEEALKRFTKVRFDPSWKIQRQYSIDLQRDLVLVISDIGTPSGFIHLISKSRENFTVTDIIVIYNWDYDKDYYVEDLKALYFGLTRKELI